MTFRKTQVEEKRTKKTPPKVKQQSKDSKGSNPDSKEVFALTKKEMRAKDDHRS